MWIRPPGSLIIALSACSQYNHSVKRQVSQNTLQSSVPPRAWPQAITPKGLLSCGFLLQAKLMLTRRQEQVPAHNTGFKRFPLDNFTYYLTLFSKFFSSFPHGTCSLSVSCLYLALDGTYHPLRAAVPSNSTRRTSTVRQRTLRHRRDCHPL